MNPILTLLAALLLLSPTALHAADAPKPKPNLDQFAGVDPDNGAGPRTDKATARVAANRKLVSQGGTR